MSMTWQICLERRRYSHIAFLESFLADFHASSFTFEVLQIPRLERSQMPMHNFSMLSHQGSHMTIVSGLSYCQPFPAEAANTTIQIDACRVCLYTSTIKKSSAKGSCNTKWDSLTTFVRRQSGYQIRFFGFTAPNIGRTALNNNVS